MVVKKYSISLDLTNKDYIFPEDIKRVYGYTIKDELMRAKFLHEQAKKNGAEDRRKYHSDGGYNPCSYGVTAGEKMDGNIKRLMKKKKFIDVYTGITGHFKYIQGTNEDFAILGMGRRVRHIDLREYIRSFGLYDESMEPNIDNHKNYIEEVKKEIGGEIANMIDNNKKSYYGGVSFISEYSINIRYTKKYEKDIEETISEIEKIALRHNFTRNN